MSNLSMKIISSLAQKMGKSVSFDLSYIQVPVIKWFVAYEFLEVI